MDSLSYPPLPDWRTWRLTHRGLTWRVAVPADAPAIDGLLDATERRLRCTQERPDLFAMPVMICLVAEDGSGTIVDGVYVQLVAEISKLTLRRDSFAACEQLLPVIGGLLEARKVRVAQMWTNRRWSRLMSGALRKMGFAAATEAYTCWTRKV